MLKVLYRILWYIAAPLVVLRLLIRARHDRGYIEHISERFGYTASYTACNDLPLIWIHAVSLGETQAAQPLVKVLLDEYPSSRVLLTHMTPSGRALSQQLFGTRVLRCYLPYDMSGPVRRFLRAWRPALGIVMETEVWPTLIDECRNAGVPLVLTNARMSERSYYRALRLGAAMRQVFSGFTRVLAQSPSDARRLSTLGASNVVVVGNMKFDTEATPELVQRGQAWHIAIGHRPVWIAGSTCEGEEDLILNAYHQLGITDALLMIVPRHPWRFNKVAALVKRSGFKLARRSEWASTSLCEATTIKPLPDDIQVLLGDSMGEMRAYYTSADVAFIGGSLLPFGGHNLIEACAVGVPIVIGPYTFNFAQASIDAVTSGAALRVQDSATLAKAVRIVLTDRTRCVEMGAAGSAFAARHRGAVLRTVNALKMLLPARKLRPISERLDLVS
ncbi:lipid IV(A) 3-deoxy-D-manno-octulosonic acid transferase [Candidatus Vallotia tarda]|uniref:3-deoxy-D-manno-octulosonic acid transferase n=1 Tax=Candidatus Vallotiella hemipterorum TaxID=1177213 RepID=A0A916NKG6_9BURK|nr:lipid IV(A) 3-deoxy-D-manno-octulosonic acid transferase [Candidatus Vallotia tarda]CAG7597823.1 3-deoxy-D-manno-octulosonic acid transferase [Candidatus Vallotia tarda]